MITMRLTESTEVSVSESDRHTQLVHVQYNRHIVPENIHSRFELFLTVEQMDMLGKFLLREADTIRCLQKERNK